MSIAFGPREASGPGLMRRLAVAVTAARDALLDEGRALDQRIHEARRRLKLARAVVAALADALPDEAKHWRKALKRAGRDLSGARDADVLLAHAGALRDEAPPELREALVSLCAVLAERAQAVRQTDLPIAEVAQRLDDLDGDVAAARLPKRYEKRHDDDRDLLTAAILAAHHDGRERLEAAREGGSEALHAWRKAVKQRWYLTRLAERRLSAIDRRLIERLDRLGEILGEEHDYCVLSEAVEADPAIAGGQDAAGRIVEMLTRRRATLREAAFDLGAVLYADKPKRFRRLLLGEAES